MSLDSLPLEILSMILHDVGASEFRERIDRLLVCKRWYSVAQSVLLGDLQLSARQLFRFPPPSEHMRTLLKTEVRHLSVRLVGWEDPSVADDSDRERHLDEWRLRLNNKLLELASMLPDLVHLKGVSFEAFSTIDPARPHLPPRDYLWNMSMGRLLSKIPTHGLTTLVLDTCGSFFMCHIPNGEVLHVCPLVAQQLVTLRHLRLRMCYICPQILRLSDNEDARFPLESLIIDLKVHTGPSWARYAKDCSMPQSSYALQTKMVETVAHAAPDMPDLRMASVICRKISSPEPVTVNCLVQEDRERFLQESGD